MDPINNFDKIGNLILCVGLIATLLRLFLKTDRFQFTSGSALMSLAIGVQLFLLRAQNLEVQSELEVFIILLELIGGSCFLLFLFLASRDAGSER